MKVWYSRGVALLVIGYLVAMSASAVVVHFFGDRSALGTLALFAPRHLTPWPWALLVPLSITVSRRLLAAALLGLGITLFAVSGFQLPSAAAVAARFSNSAPITAPINAANSAHLRVVFYNTDASRTLGSRVRTDVDAWDADVAALVDCRPDVQAALRNVPNTTLVVTPFLCMLTRHTVVSHEPLPNARLSSERALSPSRSLRAHRFTLDVRGEPVTLYVLHLTTPRDALWAARNFDLSKLDANTQLRALDSNISSRWVDRAAPGLLVMGDFNLTVESVIYRRDWGDLTNAFSDAGFGFGRTMFAGWHRVRIDHVLTGPALRAERVRVLRGYPSEHQPVMADLVWR